MAPGPRKQTNGFSVGRASDLRTFGESAESQFDEALIATAMKLHSENYMRAKYALAMVESSNNVSARNRVSTASGKYQFMRVWDHWFKHVAGKTWSSTVPKRSASAQVKAHASKEQEELFDVYYRLRVQPWIAWVRSVGLGKKYGDYELLAIYHRQGEYEAERYLRYGRDPNAGKKGNRHMKVYLASVKKHYTAYGVRRTAMTLPEKPFMLAAWNPGGEMSERWNARDMRD